MKRHCILILLVPALVFNTEAQEPATILTNWMSFHCRMARQAQDIAHVAFIRQFSYAAIAAYESMVESDASYCSLSGQIKDMPALTSSAGKKRCWPASLNAAYAVVMRYFYQRFPACVAAIDSMQKSQNDILLQDGVSSQQLKLGAAYGKAVAAAIVRWAAKDTPTNSKVYTAIIRVGFWNPGNAIPAEPFWWRRRRFTKMPEQLFVLQPPVYSADTSSSFYRQANEVYTVSLRLTPAQRATALYWDDSPNGQYISVFGHWTSILAQLIKAGNLPLLKAATAYAKMTITMHEATILAWRAKYQYNIVRPVTYIQQHIDKGWTPLIATPVHPEFPAAHATFSNAAATALKTLLGESCAFKDSSYTDIGLSPRSFTSLQEAAHEAGLSRLYGGIHYRYSIEQGFVLGEKIGNYIDSTLQFHCKK
jgi:PAP2 superfamily